MKLVCILVAFGVSGILANDVIWMELMSSSIIDATEGKSEVSNKTIPELATDLGLNVLVKLVDKAGLTETLSGEGPFTLFGPTDRAFRELPKKFVDFLLKNVTVLSEILKYHVASGSFPSSGLTDNQLVPSVQGKNIRINIYQVKNTTVITASGRPVILADQEASNGIIHEVAGVLFPPPGTIMAVISKCPAFRILSKAVTAAGLNGTLDGEGPFTLFAPSDRAFARIPKKCLDALLKNTTLLTSVLEYHVVPSVGYSIGLSNGDELKTVQGGTVKITKMFRRIRVNYSRVVYPDATTTNGVMHVIDRVLWPRGMDEMCDDVSKDYDDTNDAINDFTGNINFFDIE